MPTTLVLGSQWGDEGKGKLVDILAQHASLCCRAAGGNNAGHTIVANGITYDFHILPSGLINPSCQVNLIGTGVVVHIPSFFKELDALEAKGLQGVRDRIFISDRAHVCFDLHAKVDGAVEDASGKVDGGKGKIGTTRKGIGPCYSAKVARNGVTFWMLCNDGNRWEQRLRNLESAYRKTYGDIALEGYSLEDEIAAMKVSEQTICAIGVYVSLLTFSILAIPRSPPPLCNRRYSLAGLCCLKPSLRRSFCTIKWHRENT
jgi:adenylosuccinate synthase